MSSSQGGSVGSSTNQVSAGYTFDQDSIRDGSDWTRFKRQALIYKDYNSASATQTRPAWDMRGNNFRLSYALGQFKCKASPACQGDAIENTIVPIPADGLPF
jgi:hypothetical protein